MTDQTTAIELQQTSAAFQSGLAAFADTQITTDKQQTAANAALVYVKQRLKFLDGKLKEFTKPHREAEKAVRDWFRPSLALGEQLETLLKRRMAEYQRFQSEAKAKALEVAAAAYSAGQIEQGRAALAKAPEVAQVRGTSFRAVWKFEVIDPAAVPSQYCSPDPDKLKAALALGAREIPGVKIYEDTVVTTRT